MFAQPGDHNEDAPETQNDAGHSSEQFDENRQRLSRPRRRHFDKIDSGGNAQGNSNHKSDDGRDQCAKDKGQRAELLSDRVPF